MFRTNLDSVLDEFMREVFNGTPEEVEKWLKENPSDKVYTIGIGKTMAVMSVPEYLADKKYQAVLRLVLKAVKEQDVATYHGDASGMLQIAAEAALQIVKIV